MTYVSFLTVKDNVSKISRVCGLTSHLFQQNKKTVICVPNVEIGKYIDAMLWKYPESGFIPHIMTNSSSEETIIIATSKDPFKDYSTLINLCPNIHENFQHFKTVYELYDTTHPTKEASSIARIDAYKSKNITPHMD